MGTIWVPNIAQKSGAKYQQVYQAIDEAVRAGTLAQGEKLPPIRALAFELSMTPTTIVRAYQLGVDNGILSARTGDGTYVKSRDLSLSDLAERASSLVARHDGYNLRTASVPRLGQTALANALLKQILDDTGLEINHYTTPDEIDALQDKIADFLTSEGLECRGDEICLTKGATQAAGIASKLIAQAQARKQVATEPECYIGFRDIELMNDLELVPIRVDKGGMMPFALEAACEARPIGMIVTSSVIQNPYSLTLTGERMQEIVRVARKFDLAIVDDVVHAHLIAGKWHSFRDLAPERTWTVTSLAKIGYPALQLGVILPPKERAREVQDFVAANNIRPSELQRPLAMALLSSPLFAQILKETRREVAYRQDMVRRILRDFDVQMAEGAPFFWLKLPISHSVSSFVAEIGAQNITIAAADVFTAPGHVENAVRVTLGGVHTRTELDHALCVIRQALRRRPQERVV